MKDDKDTAIPADEPASPGEMTEAEIDQNLADTFPASDPPSWTLGTNHVQTPQPPDPADDSDEE